MKFNLQLILLICLLFLSSNKGSKSFDGTEQNVNYEDYNKFEETMNENFKKKEIIEILDLLKAANEQFKMINTTEKAKEKFEKNAKTLFANIMLKYVIPATVPKIVEEFIKKKSEEIFREHVNNNSTIYENLADYILEENGIYENIKSKYPLVSDLILSFSNFAWSCYEFYITYKETNKIGLYEEKLEQLKNIVDKFDSNNYFELKLEDDYDTIKIKIINKIKEIKKIYKELEDLITDIESSTEILKYQQEKSIMSGIAGEVSVILGTAGAIFTGGLSLFFSLLGGLAMEISYNSFYNAEEGIKKLKVILKKAKKVKKEFEKKIDELIEKTKAKIYNK